MTTREKILLLQLILEDIRGNWCRPKERAEKAQTLCEELAKETNNDQYLFLAKRCSMYIIDGEYSGDWDGRRFRIPFPYGYENMSELHGLTNSYYTKSKDFQSVAKEYLTHPEYRFDDWEE